MFPLASAVTEHTASVWLVEVSPIFASIVSLGFHPVPEIVSGSPGLPEDGETEIVGV
jgi:hypothetical protein